MQDENGKYVEKVKRAKTSDVSRCPEPNYSTTLKTASTRIQEDSCPKAGEINKH